MRHKRIIIHMFVPGQIAKERIELQKKKKQKKITTFQTTSRVSAQSLSLFSSTTPSRSLYVLDDPTYYLDPTPSLL